jgi:hypothetical protein
MHLCEDVSQLKARLDCGDFDFLLNYLLAKPDSFDSIVFASRGELRWQSSGQKQGA